MPSSHNFEVHLLMNQQWEDLPYHPHILPALIFIMTSEAVGFEEPGFLIESENTTQRMILQYP